MKSGRSFCSIPIFRKNCARFWPLCGGFFLLLTVYVLRFADGGPGMASSPAANFLDSVNGMMIAWLPLYGLMCGVLFLGYLFQTGSTQAYHSMPLRRGTLLGTAILSGLVFLLAPLALAAALAYLLIPGCTTEPLEWAAVLGIVSFYAFALSCLSAVLTGTRPGAVLVFVVFNRRAQSGGHGKGGCIAPSAGPGISRYGVAVALPTHHAFGAGRCGGGTFCPPPLAIPSCRGRRGLGVAWPGVVFVPPPEK